MADQGSFLHLARPLPTVPVPHALSTTAPLNVTVHTQVRPTML